LPPAWHWLYFPELARASDLGPEGHPRLGLFLPPVPLPRRMWAGGHLAWHAPLHVGDVVDRTTVIRSITPKNGQTGPLYFVTLEHTLRTGDTLNLVEEQTMVYRALDPAGPARPAPAAPANAEFSQTHTLDSVALFRYSALTFNEHRIHYDVDYCRQVEGYPNLVIHGPLLATLLIELYARTAGRSFHQFRYRAVSPLFLPHAFTVNGQSDGGAARLWAANHQGRLAMEAEIS
jgi:3-methylfumaryl-CoA hydratase